MGVQQVLVSYKQSTSSPGAHRYWRINITSNNGSTLYYGFSEIILRDPSGVDRTSGASGSGATWVTATSQINVSNQPRNTVDGDPTGSGWLTANISLPAWIRYDMQDSTAPSPRTAIEVKSFDMWPSHNALTATPKDFSLQWSDDNTNWTTALSVTNQTGWTIGVSRTFTVF